MMDLDLSLENLYRQYYRCRRNKRNTVNALRFEAEQERQLVALREELLDRSYQPGRSVCFFTRRPKLREIFAADFRDRIVHHLLVDYLERLWEPVFIHDSYACRRGKGVHHAVTRLTEFLGQATANGTRKAWYLQLDIRNYFMRIDKELLFERLARRLPGEAARWLTRLLVFHDCTRDYVLRDAGGLIARVPAHKTLFHADPGKGLPIGNLNSQFFANVYLDGLDQFVKHTLKCRHYLRYCDDFVLLAPERETLSAWRDRIEVYLAEALRLELNPRERLAPVGNGIDFLGYIVRRDYRLVRRRVVGHLREKLRAFERELVVEGVGYRRYRFDRAVLDALHATLASYLGHFRWADSRRLWQGVWREFPFLGAYFTVDGPDLRLTRRYLPSLARRVRSQYHDYRRRFPDDALLFQVGRFIECHDHTPPRWAMDFGLRIARRNRRGMRCGFPLSQLLRRRRALLAAGFPITEIRERRMAGSGIVVREPLSRLVPHGTGGGGATWRGESRIVPASSQCFSKHN